MIYLDNKNQAEVLLEKGIVEIRKKTAYTEVWQKVGLEKKQCLNYQ